MDFGLSEEQEMLRAAARDFLADRCPPSRVRQMLESAEGYSPELWREMAGLGWMGLAFPEEYGGSGMGFIDLAILLEEMGRACLPGPFFSSVVLGGMTILDAGSRDQKQQLLPPVARGESIITLALTEPGGGYDAAAIATTATPGGDGYTISGTKLFVPDAHLADSLLCVARAPGSSGEAGISIFIVPAGTPGISLRPLATISGDRLFEVKFEAVRVPAAGRLGPPEGWPVVQRTLDRAAVARSCDIVGAIQRVLEMTLDYARERRQFNRPIGSFQVIQHYCAQMATDVDGARFVTYQAAWRLGEGLPCRADIAVAKVWTGEAYERVITLAHQIHGAIGCTIDHDLHLFTRRGKAAQLSFGSADYHRETVAQAIGL